MAKSTIYYPNEVIEIVNDELNKTLCEELDSQYELDAIIVRHMKAYKRMATRIVARFQETVEKETKDDQ